MAEVINPTLSFPSVPWEFSTRNNTFSGEGGGFDTNTPGDLTLSAKFDDEGNFKTGTFSYRLDNHLLLQGKLSGPLVEAVPSHIEGINDFYRVTFGLIVHRDDLPFPVDGGTFEAYVCDARGECRNEAGDNGPTSLEGVFTTDYTGASVSLNNYLRTFHDDDLPAPLPLLAAAPVPAPASGVLLGLGLVILLVAMRMRRLT